jgi:hypothetical protein
MNHKIALVSAFAGLALLSQAQQHGGTKNQSRHTDGIEFQMGRDEQSMVLRTYDNADRFQKAVKREISTLKQKIDKSSGDLRLAQQKRKARLETMDQIINGCVMSQWHKLEEQRMGSADAIDQLIQSFQNQLN